VKNSFGYRTFLVALWVAVWVLSCSKPSYIDVAYQLPSETQALAGKQISLSVIDSRTDPEIFAGEAKKEFEHFTGIFSLSLKKNNSSYIVGTYDLPALFTEALKRRIESTGIRVETAPSSDGLTLEISLQRFLLNAEKRKWIADIKYNARLIKNKKILANQEISGQAERTKIMGSGGGETVLGEIFTDSVNRFDIFKLFGEAGLI
jgi:hypothetical protein